MICCSDLRSDGAGPDSSGERCRGPSTSSQPCRPGRDPTPTPIRKKDAMRAKASDCGRAVLNSRAFPAPTPAFHLADATGKPDRVRGSQDRHALRPLIQIVQGRIHEIRQIGVARSEAARSAACRRHFATKRGRRVSATRIWTGRRPAARRAFRRLRARSETGLGMADLLFRYL